MFHRTLRRIDCYQQEHGWIGFPIAVAKKYGDDRGGILAASIAYYGFLSILPLFLVLVTVLGILLQGNENLRTSILNTVIAQFPIIGDQLKSNVKAITGNTIALAVGVVGALWGGLGLMQTAQTALNDVWGIPRADRPDYVRSLLRSLLMLALLGLTLLASATLSIVASIVVRSGFQRAAGIVGAYTLALALFLIAYRLLPRIALSVRDVVQGSALAAFAWLALQQIGVYFVDRQIRHATALYGFFGFTIGLLLWIYLGAQVMLFGAEIDAVRARGLWPRSIAPTNASDGSDEATNEAPRGPPSGDREI